MKNFFYIISTLRMTAKYVTLLTLAVVANIFDILFLILTYRVIEILVGRQNSEVGLLQNNFQFLDYGIMSGLNQDILIFITCVCVCVISYLFKLLVLYKESFFIQETRRELIRVSLMASLHGNFKEIANMDVSNSLNAIVMRSVIISSQLVRSVVKFHVGAVTFIMIGTFIVYLTPLFLAAIFITVAVIGVMLYLLRIKSRSLGLAYDQTNEDLLEEVGLTVHLQRTIRLKGLIAYAEGAVNKIAQKSMDALAMLQILKQSPRVIVEFTVFVVLFAWLSTSFVIGNPVEAEALASSGVAVLIGLQRMFPVLSLANTAYTGIASSSHPISEFKSFLGQSLDSIGSPSAAADDFNAIHCKNISFSYNDNNLDTIYIDDIEINIGDVLKINGPSGSGKSTIILLILKLLNPKSGRVQILNNKKVEIPNFPSSSIEFVSNDEPVFGNSISEYLERYSGHTVEEDYLKFLFKEFNMEKFWKIRNACKPTELSLGERQRLKIIKAFSNRHSRLIVLDEALSNLDSKNINIVIKNIKDALRTKAFIVVSHDSSLDAIATKNFTIVS
ncbi:ATP-binding cassette domain-containing protein [Rhodobacterales bacterium FZCC0188]|nr:ATP-binding cassette domain-containing protein [Rhodobacterales bacterium FZCC0188]